jgi:hypothetical protein
MRSSVLHFSIFLSHILVQQKTYSVPFINAVNILQMTSSAALSSRGKKRGQKEKGTGYFFIERPTACVLEALRAENS